MFRRFPRMLKKLFFWLLIISAAGVVVYLMSSEANKEKYKAMLSNVPFINKLIPA